MLWNREVVIRSIDRILAPKDLLKFIGPPGEANKSVYACINFTSCFCWREGGGLTKCIGELITAAFEHFCHAVDDLSAKIG